MPEPRELSDRIADFARDHDVDSEKIEAELEAAVAEVGREAYGDGVECRFDQDRGLLALFRVVTIVADRPWWKRLVGKGGPGEVTESDARQHNLHADAGDDLLFEIFYRRADRAQLREQNETHGALLGVVAEDDELEGRIVESAERVFSRLLVEAELSRRMPPEVPDSGVEPPPSDKRPLLSDEADSSGPVEFRVGTAEYEEFVARGELELGENLAHGFGHLAELLRFDPARPEWLKLAAAYIRAAGSTPEQLLEASEEPYFAAEAMRAYLYERNGRLDDAVSRLVEVAASVPRVPYLATWAVDWLEPAGRLERLRPEVAASYFATALNTHPEHRFLTERQRARLRRVIALAERYVKAHRITDESALFVAGLYRKAGLFEKGLEFLHESSGGQGSWHERVAEGLILREMGRAKGAEAAFLLALEADPDDLAARLEAADTHFRAGSWAGAEDLYLSVLERDPEHSWAKPSALYCKWRQGVEGPDHQSEPPHGLLDLAQGDEPNARALELLKRWLRYEGYLPEPHDATADMIRRLLPKLSETDGGVIRVRTSDVEGPSNRVAFYLGARLAGRDDAELELTYENLASPDPRLPVEEVTFRLWKREGSILVPALPVPPDDLVEEIAAIAATPFETDIQWALASQVATKWGPTDLEALLACIVNPPPPNDRGCDVLVWVQRVQLAATHVIAQLEEGWLGSVRRQALYSVLLGPRDWSTEAAILSLARLVEDEPALSLDVGNAFQRLADAEPDSGFCNYKWALCRCWMSLPHLFPDEREQLGEILKSLDEPDDRHESWLS